MSSNNIELPSVLKAFFTLVESYGGFFDIKLLSTKLNKTEEEVINDINNNKFFSLEHSGKILIPAFQFISFKPLPYLSDVLDNMKEVDSWSKIVFFVTQIPKLNDYPAHILKKEPEKSEIEVIMQSARIFSEHKKLEYVI